MTLFTLQDKKLNKEYNATKVWFQIQISLLTILEKLADHANTYYIASIFSIIIQKDSA